MRRAQDDLFALIEQRIGAWEALRQLHAAGGDKLGIVRPPFVLDDLVYAHGVPFRERTAVAKPQPKSRECYFNAWRYLHKNLTLLYCEGYAYARDWVIPVMHGWCVDPEGVVYDPSVGNDEEVAYIGFAYRPEWAAAMWQKLRTPEIAGIGILGNLWQLDIGFPDVRANLQPPFAKGI